tara:strand:- start:386 stop:1495 length:1110 start_codon:yes stop_codon:yes gene_type:complete
MSKAAELAKMGEVLTNNQIGGRRNIVINGGMQIAQRSTSETGKGDADGYFTLDRYKINVGATSAGRFTMSQSTDTPNGFANSLKIDCTTADTSIAAGERLTIDHRIEGQNLQQIKKGTSDAEKMTLSFYAKVVGSATDFVVDLMDNDNTRQVSNLFTFTTSWVRYYWTIPADTTGAFDNDNGNSLNIQFWLHGGSNFTSGTLNTSWASSTDANRAVGIDSIFSSTDNEIYLTGIQLEVGEVATPFEHRSFGEELALCQRYFQQWTQEASGFSTNNYAAVCDAVMHSSTLPFMQYVHPTVLRATPSLTFNGSFAANISGSDYGMSSFTPNTSTPYVTSFYASTGSAGAGKAGFMRASNDGDASIFFDSEL